VLTILADCGYLPDKKPHFLRSSNSSYLLIHL
jgi:hypothetical protein